MGATVAVLIWAVTAATLWMFLSGKWPMPELISVHGRDWESQHLMTITIVGIVFTLAQIGLGWCVFKFTDKKPGPATYTEGSAKVETTWTLITAAIFVMLGITGQRVWANFHLTDPPKDAIMIEVTGQQFAWNIRYPGPDGVFGRTDVKLVDDAAGNPLGLDDKDPAARDDVVTQNQMAVPVNRPIRLILKSKDVTHNFFVPQARMKQDAVPGLATFMHFTLTKPGKYEVACAELCGQLHWQMKGFINVMSDEEYQNWLKERAP